MLSAINGMKRKRDYQDRYINSRLYEMARKEFAKEHSKSLKGKKLNPEHKEAINRARIKYHENCKKNGINPMENIHKAAIEANTGAKRTIEQRERMSIAQKTSVNKKVYADYSKDKQREIRNAISAGLKGKPKTEKHKIALSKATKGKYKGIAKSEITKQRVRKPKSPEHAAKISESRSQVYMKMRIMNFLLLVSNLL